MSAKMFICTESVIILYTNSIYIYIYMRIIIFKIKDDFLFYRASTMMKIGEERCEENGGPFLKSLRPIARKTKNNGVS